MVERAYRPARVLGSSGTGKTIVALNRAVHLARTHSDARVLLTTLGAEPVIRILRSPDEDTAAIAEWLKSRGPEGHTPDKMRVFVRSKVQLTEPSRRLKWLGVPRLI